MLDSIFYVYLFLHPVSLEPLYIGKGKYNRAFDHLKPYKKKSHFKNKISKLVREVGQPLIKFVATDLAEQDALLLESMLIKHIGRRDLGLGSLYNLTDGGDGGASGTKRSEETKRRMSNARRNRSLEAEARSTYALRNKTPEHIAKIAKARKGQSVSQETREKISATSKATWARKKKLNGS